MSNLIDRYILGARVAPVAVVSFSLFLAISAWIPFSHWPIKLLGGSAFLALGAFVLAQLARDAGKAVEGPLWASWGGPRPSECFVTVIRPLQRGASRSCIAT
jgi:hypothetical protein